MWAKTNTGISLGRTIHIIGTNGKGSTGRMLATILQNLGYSVGHYSSPHVLAFHERIWINGETITDMQLSESHAVLIEYLNESEIEQLSYFEYSTFLAFIAFQNLDFAIIEAGLGGEFDATNVIDKELTLITNIGMDHEAYLGSTIKEIAATKVRSVDAAAILGYQRNFEAVEVADELSKEMGFLLYVDDFLVKDSDHEMLDCFIAEHKFPEFQKKNFKLAVSAIRYFGLNLGKHHLEGFSLPGRMQKVAENVTVDVGHNTLAAEVIKNEFSGRKVILVYNSLSDKNYSEILKIMCPIIDKMNILPLGDPRAVDEKDLLHAAKKLGIETEPFTTLDPEKEYLVCGSFLTVETFMKEVL